LICPHLVVVNNIRDKKILVQFGNHLRKLRQKNNLSLEALANEADVEISQIYRIEKALVNPTLSSLVALAKALNIPLKELVDF
jgi:transcriptional regulator with XRE-family HTH domain